MSGGCVGEACEMMEVLTASWGYVRVRLFQQLMGRHLDGICDVVSTSLNAFESPICWSPNLFPSLVMELPI